MAIEDFKCPLTKIKPVEEWIKEPETDESCPPCLIAPLSSYYLGSLEEAGEKALAEELKVVFQAGDIYKIAKKLDNIKSDVGDKLKADLLELDCFAQVFKRNEA